MADRPPEIYDPAARDRLMRDLLHERNIDLDVIVHTVPNAVYLGNRTALYGDHVAAVAGGNPDALRFAAAVFALWARTFDLAADYQDTVVTELSDTGLDALTEHLRRQVGS